MKRFLNLFYTDTFKALLFITILVFSWLTSSCTLKTTEIYKDDPAAVMNVIVQRTDFDFPSSVLLEKEIDSAIKNVVSYSLDYHRNDDKIEETSPYDFAYYIDMVVYLANTLVKDNVVHDTFIENGFIELIPSRTKEGSVEIDGKHYRQKVNEERIRSFAEYQKDVIIEYARRSMDSNYRNLAETIDSYKDFTFALVNHTTGKIVSNIENINTKSSSEPIRQYFGNNGSSLLIVRDAKNPYFESGTMKNYVSNVKKVASNYSDNFDLYISFPDNFEFSASEQDYAQRHIDTAKKMYHHINKAVVYLFIATVLFIILVFLAGKKEIGGKVYLSTFDKIPNDALILLYIIVIVCLFVLIDNSLYMIIKTTDYENYWFNRTPGYYVFRANATLTGAVITLIAFACTLKRQYKNKTLIKNTYIHRLITNYKLVLESKRKDK